MCCDINMYHWQHCLIMDLWKTTAFLCHINKCDLNILPAPGLFSTLLLLNHTKSLQFATHIINNFYK